MKERSVRPPTNSSPKREGGNHTLGTEVCRVSDSADGCPVPRSPRPARSVPVVRSRTNWAATGAILMSPSVPSEGTVRATRRWLPHPP